MRSNSRTETQMAVIQSELLAGKRINSVMAFQEYCITRLSAIIERLRKRGWPINSVKQDGNGIADYSLPDGWQPPAQKSPGRS